MYRIGHYRSKSKVLLVVVSIWVAGFSAFSAEPTLDLIKQAEQLQKSLNGDQKAIDLLWKNSEKLQRPDMLFLAKLLVKKRNFKDILKVSEMALAKNPQDAEFLTFQGKAYLETGKDKKTIEKAQESLRSAIEANPKFEPAYLILDDSYERQDQDYKAQKKPPRFLQTRRLLYEDLVKNNGEKELYIAKLCEINAADGVNEDALKQCKRAIELDKADVKSQINLAQVYKQTDNKKDAMATLDKAVKDNPKSPEVLIALGNQLEEDKNHADSYNRFKYCLEISAGNDECLRGLGTAAASLKKWQESYDSFQALCRRDRKWSADVRKASMTAKDLGDLGWQQKFLELSLNCNI
jgi:tetratricopeptide (TPR) repeat protein